VKSSVIQEMTSSLPTIVPHNHPQRLGGKWICITHSRFFFFFFFFISYSVLFLELLPGRNSQCSTLYDVLLSIFIISLLP
jgi:hypothetical protein